MADPSQVVITSLGFCTALGNDPVSALARGESAVAEQDALSGLPHRTAAVVDKVDLRDALKRRKDRKLMARPSQLALASGAQALSAWSVQPTPSVSSSVSDVSPGMMASRRARSLPLR